MITEQAAFLGPQDMIIVMIVALIVFGPQKLPEVGRQLGQAIRELKKLTGELTESIHSESEGIKSAFDTVSPYKVISGPIDVEQKRPEPHEGYSEEVAAVKESPLLIAQADAVGEVPGQSTMASSQEEAATAPLAAVAPKAGEQVQ